MFCCFFCKVTAFFVISKLFFNFFLFLAFSSPSNHKFCFYAGCPVFLLFRCCAVSGVVLVVVVCPDDYLPIIIHTRIHTRARGLLASNF